MRIANTIKIQHEFYDTKGWFTVKVNGKYVFESPEEKPDFEGLKRTVVDNLNVLMDNHKHEQLRKPIKQNHQSKTDQNNQAKTGGKSNGSAD